MKRPRLTPLCRGLFLCTALANTLAAFPDGKEPHDIGLMLTQELLSRPTIHVLVESELPNRPDLDQRIYENYTGIHYAEACAGMGAVAFAKATNNEALLQELIAHYTPLLDQGPVSSGNHVDCNVFGILPFEIYQATGDEAWLQEGLRLADLQWAECRPDGLTSQARMWIDDMWMVGSLQTQAWKATQNPVYLDRAARFLVTYSEALQQTNGLFYHGDNSPHHWGRGNGWVASALAFTLSELPETHPDYPRLQLAYTRMMAALLQYQSEQGLWRQLIDNPDAWQETSCTAMFAWSMALGIEQGTLTDPTYQTAVEQAWNGLCDYLDEDGRLHEVCIGTGKVDSIQFYLDRPRSIGDLHGQAPMLWLATALLHRE